jgi:glycosyltransferase involved in cell wall biosynthesis
MQVSIKPEDVTSYPFLAKPYAFKVCRIEPENNIEMILKAFSAFDKYPLVLVGNWDKSPYGQNLRATYGGKKNLLLLDPIYDQQKIDLIRGNATVYVHGHSAGGTNPSLVEAMYLGLPIISFGVSYNRTTTEGKAIYFSNSEELSDLLCKVKPPALLNVGQKMKEIADRRYRWDLIANKYQALVEKAYERTSKESVTPSFREYDREVLSEYGAAHLAMHNLFFEKT